MLKCSWKSIPGTETDLMTPSPKTKEAAWLLHPRNQEPPSAAGKTWSPEPAGWNKIEGLARARS